jgi:hypothetical protein
MVGGPVWARRAAASSVCWLAACAFDSAGLGVSQEGTDSDGTSSGSSSGTSTTTRATEDGETSSAESTGGSDDTPDATTTGEEQGEAVLEFTDPQSHGNFGGVELEELDTRIMTLTNVGAAQATQVGWSGLEGPFEFTGGVYPGVGGDCSDVLDVGASCGIELDFAPHEPGPAESELVVHYHDGTMNRLTARALLGYGEGATTNLLVNGDAESCTAQGQSPPGWTKATGSGWQCGNGQGVEPYAGRWSFYAGNEGDSGTFELRQDVDVSAYLGYTFFFAGGARSLSNDDDDYRMDIVFLDEQDVQLGSWSIGWQTHGSWEHYQHELSAPPDTQTVSVRLFCTKGSSGSWCDAFFDEIELRAVYTAPG